MYEVVIIILITIKAQPNAPTMSALSLLPEWSNITETRSRANPNHPP